MADDDANNPTWTCEACSCRTNTERSDPISCGVCGTRRAPTLLRRGGPASRLLHDAFSHHAAADEDDDVSENEETSEPENGSDDEDAMDHHHNSHSAEEDFEDHDDSPPPSGIGGEDVEAARAAAAAVAALDAAGGSEGHLRSRHGSAGSRMLRAVAGGSAALSLLHAGGGRIPRSSRSSSSSNSSSSIRSMDPEALLRIVTENAELYRPVWTATSNAPTLAGRHHAPSPPGGRSPPGSGGGSSGGNGIIVDSERHPNVAHLPDGAGEGRAVRATPPIPRSAPSSPGRNHPPSRSSALVAAAASATSPSSALDRKRRRMFGFRVAFDHPGRDDGRSMGGCYLVGVTTSSFAAFGERSGLQQSRQFWGVEDGGRKYEGSNSPSSSSRRSRHASSSNRPNSSSSAHGMTLSRSEAPRNSDNVLFGSREVITVVVDMDARTLTYWRDGRFLGTLVTNLPRTGHLYPVAVPFNAGVSVGITGMDGDPLSSLSEFHTAQKRARKEKDEKRRQTLSSQRSNLIQNNRITPQLYAVLQNIFSWYATEETPPGAEVTLDAISAARLWYRCGMQLSHLKGVLDASSAESIEPKVNASGFIDIVSRVVAEEEEELAKKEKEDAFTQSLPGSMVGDVGVRPLSSEGIGVSGGSSPSSFEVGDKVEVSEGYERYGDARSGPLRPGYRGTVMEVQRGPRGDRQSVRVMHNGRRWWYQPQALLSERSGLLESPAVRFLRTILRSHGYDHTTLEPLWGKTVTPESWQIGDLVAPLRLSPKYARAAQVGRSTPLSFTMIGRIVPDTSSLPSASARGRESGLVTVEFIDPLFGRAVGAIGGSGIGSGSMSVSTRRVKARNLVHTTFYHGATVIDENNFDSNRMDSSLAADIENRTIADAVAAMVANSGGQNEDDEIYEEDQETSENADDSEESTDEAMQNASFVVNETLKTNVAKIAKLDTSAINAVAKECGKNSASLAGLFAVGLPDAILSAIDYADNKVNVAGSSGKNSNAVDASSVSALGSLAVAVSKQLFANEHDSPPNCAEAADFQPWRQNTAPEHASTIRSGQAPLGMGGGPSPPWGPDSSLQDMSFHDGNMPHSHPYHAPPHFNHPSNQPNNHPGNHPNEGGGSHTSRQHLNVRDLIRDLGNSGSTAEHRRGVLLALMAGARMSDDTSSLSNAASSAREAEYRHLAAAAQQQRSRHGLPSYERLSAEAAAFGFGMAPTASYNRQYPHRQHYPPPPHLEDLSGALSAGMGGVGIGSPPIADMSGMAPSAMPPSSASITSSTPALPSSSTSGHRSNSASMRNSSAPSLLESLLRGYGGSNTAFAASLNISRSGSGSRGSTQMSASACSIIQNGLLLNNALWVKKVLGVGGSSSSSSSSSIDLQSIRDEDGTPLLFLACSLGCSTAIVNSLIKCGARVSEKEVHVAAVSNQPRTLSILLRHTVYTKGTIDVTRCSMAVIKTLNQAAERQRVQEDMMKRDAGEFTSRLLRKMVGLGLRFRLLCGRGSTPKSYEECSRAVSDALVGDVLLHAMHKNQHEGMMAVMRSSDSQAPSMAALSADDGRVPAFTASHQYGDARMMASSRGHTGTISTVSGDNNGLPLSPSPPNCLLRCLPPHVLCKALIDDETLDSQYSVNDAFEIEETPPLTTFLQLTESFLWSKNIRDAAVGLSLIVALLRTPVVCQEELARYGIKDLAAAHVNIADEALAEIETSNRIRNRPSALEGAGENTSPGIVVCPKGHTTILHLTRHSSFRCDLCGKGVDQGQPMHGCRECDWDACESCTDKAEGGLVKWDHVRGLAIECQRIVCGEDDHEPNNESNEVKVEDKNLIQGIPTSDEALQRLSVGLREMKSESVHDLASMLKVPGRITFHEFKSYILPSLHSALLCNKASCGVPFSDNLPEFSNIVTPCRRSKKPRVGGSRKSEEDKKCFSKSDSFRSHAQSPESNDLAERETFGRTIVNTLLRSVDFLPEEKGTDLPTTSEENVSEEEQQIAEVHMGDGARDDEDDEEESDDGSSDHQQESTLSPKIKPIIVPEVLRLLHAVLAFNERVMVIQQRSPSSGNSSSRGNGELQTLTHPIEIEFLPFPNNEGNHKGSGGAPYTPQRREQMQTSPSTVGDGAVVHAEPLMPLAEIELHILRTCRIRTPTYLRFCRRLVIDQAVILERRASACDLGTAVQDEKILNNNDDRTTRIAKIVGFDEATGAHKIRYASLFLPTHGTANNDDENETLLYNDRSLFDQLVFQGRETMVILAARNYSIIHRNQQDVGGYDDDGVHFGMDQDCGDASTNFDVFSDAPRHQNMDLCASSVSMSTYAPPQLDFSSEPSHFKEKDIIRGEEYTASSQTLPLGMRVESDFESHDGTYSVYTIISSDIEGSSKSEVIDSTPGPTYSLVSDDGEVFLGVPSKNIRGHDAVLHQRRIQLQRERERKGRQFMQMQASHENEASDPVGVLRASHHSIFERGVPIASVRRTNSSGTHNTDAPSRSQQSSTPAVGVLKRTWSALSQIQKMSPFDLSGSNESSSGGEGTGSNSGISQGRMRKVFIGENEIEIDIDLATIEKSPSLRVGFSLNENFSAVSLPCSDDITLFSAIQRLPSRDKTAKRRNNFSLGGKVKMFYSIFLQDESSKAKAVGCLTSPPWRHDGNSLPNSFSPPWVRQGLSVDGNKLENEYYGDFAGRLSAPPYFAAGNVASFEFNPCGVSDADMEINAGPSNDVYASKYLWSSNTDGMNRPSLSSSTRNDVSDAIDYYSLCEGLNHTCVKCMELLCVLAENASRYHLCASISANDTEHKHDENGSKNVEQIMCLFESEALTNKLLEQLEDPLTVVGGALPDWCTLAPAFAPQVFSHASRRLLLERAAFGVSRSALRQQEAKVAVAPLRQRMAALRGRAVELVGEAFSGGAADPTALQLQADELYGMEEALAARVSAAFRAQHWDERSLECAKAAVRRNALLQDASGLMEHYASDTRVRRRRLEVRFEGESGFDAASGDEAGVTRGFYADVAEALLSCDHVAGILCSPMCEKKSFTNPHALSSITGAQVMHPSIDETKLPLWIPDMDSSQKVIIPTPRADPRSVLGIFPRPISSQHIQRKALLKQFRLMGRLFAAAIRDGFVFPLPLSASFLKLVQSTRGVASLARSGSSSSLVSGEYLPNNSNASVASSVSSSPVTNSNMSIEDCSNAASCSVDYNDSYNDPRNEFLPRGVSNNDSLARPCSGPFYEGYNSNSDMKSLSASRDSVVFGMELNSLDLPRPGFLGGEIYAAETYICAQLGKLDFAEPTLSHEEIQKRRKQIASDRSFARKALGKSYDCSFEEYFEDRKFVDPLDPMQGEDAALLCPNGHLRSVTIDNIREWVLLAKRFVLHDGVIAQATSFRQGVDDFFSSEALRLFTAEELQQDVCGGGDNVDKWDEKAVRSLFKLDGGKGAAEALVAVAAMGGEGGAALSRRFGHSSPTVGYLVKALLQATPTQRRQFLSFVTSVPIVTPGQIEVVPVVNPSGDFLPMSDPCCLPRANTCARRLYLPKFESYESFCQVLWAVVREECRFKGFYEWRG